MGLVAQLVGQDCDAGTNAGEEKFTTEDYPDAKERFGAAKKAAQSKPNPTSWVIVKGGSDKATYYLKYCKDAKARKLKFTARAALHHSRVYAIVETRHPSLEEAQAILHELGVPQESMVEIDCVIYNNAKVKHYTDRVLDGVVYYKGQNSGRQDNLIQAKKTLYLERSGVDVYTYVGLITEKELTSISPINEFKLTLDRTHEHNGCKSGEKLEYVEGVKKGKGSCWTKKSSLIRLGLSPATGRGNFVSGIMAVKTRVDSEESKLAEFVQKYHDGH
tara:strand:- start:413 stop:1237 length:825 start_codon:yes stop_codon:yes gene_type:complete